jgi:NADH:ubiquinone oxidoreductase subunit 2 (subunit N)
MAVVQTNVKRMLAFSSISHAGFILVGVEAAAHFDRCHAAGDGVSSVLSTCCSTPCW